MTTPRCHAGSRGGVAAAFAVSELMIALGLFATVSAGLFMGFISLQRSFAATTDFAVNHADQMRISDYLALDLRRALAVTAGTNDTVIYIPSYYDVDGSVLTPTLDGNGGVNYGAAGSSVRIHYYLANGSIYRQMGAKAATELAANVEDFTFNITDSAKVVTSTITFTPIFRSAGASAAVIAATSFNNTTLLRNSRRDMVSTVY